MSGTVKRAFELAPECGTLDEIRLRLKQEGFDNVVEHLQGLSIQRELKVRLGKKYDNPRDDGPAVFS